MSQEYPRRLFREKKIVTAVGGAYDDVTFDRIPHGEQYYVKWVSGVDEDNQVTQIRVVLVSGETEYLTKAQSTTAANLLRGWEIREWMGAGEYPVVRFYGATAGDKLVACIAGHYREYVEGTEL